MDTLAQIVRNYPITTGVVTLIVGGAAVLVYNLWPMMRQGLHLTGEGS